MERSIEIVDSKDREWTIYYYVHNETFMPFQRQILENLEIVDEGNIQILGGELTTRTGNTIKIKSYTPEDLEKYFDNDFLLAKIIEFNNTEDTSY